ncbi:hemolysin III family protein [Actinomycetaceae bacterium UMB8039B]|uniref:PAQR family membrane homeostasis protein TrhA n=1 Tax=Pauljensenia sp. UMB8040A TaxID=3046343 RepID=UPI00254D7A51|nr:hemolysin III family protein [Pauljensenia sp. UMB8040A]MDK7781021.1 hemolysin III family protein [Actinomycetaceae bacterium UMB8041B]MDK8293729.1 hemolysin III family protein [Actinomycetaceae bacterium UMB8039B]MDK8608343.1 hemolysin III family protein [Actinomycetaceae bacterium UMB8041A]MDK8753561.1 hemolysin III family protein [Actinomycetaceae bacterium UMB8039A]MDK6830420.1 hemolysin III family protein [Pauljensenia sp. UMB8040A]
MKVASLHPKSWVPNQLIAIKPHLRGWLHLVTAPLSLAASIVLICLAPTTPTKWASAVYLASSLLLFGISALYHRFYWKPNWELVWKRLDHSNIFLLIAGTYTPLSVALLARHDAMVLLSIVWIGAVIGILINLFWPTAPRRLSTLIYVVLGWTAVAYLPQLWSAGGPAIVWLIVAGGILYTLGAIVYATKRPDPSPTWFGFHEIFHAFTVAAWACHCVGVYLAVLL